MSVNQHMYDYAKWSVFWRNKKGKFVRKRFYEDLQGALRFMRDNPDRPVLTLHSDNLGFPPPRRITHFEEHGWTVVKRKGKRYKKRVVTIVNRMHDYNQKGIWWCPYCIQLRRFEFAETERGPEMFCPVCGCGNYLFEVRRYNPHAAIIEMQIGRASCRERVYI